MPDRFSLKDYALVTGAYWAFTLTDGALRMLVLLHFHQLGYSPLQIASLFLLYEFFGVLTNLFGGWIAAHMGLRATLLGGLGLQVAALLMLSGLDTGWPASWLVSYVMAAQAISGIAKDLTKMSAKSAVKVVVPDGQAGTLYKWVAVLTGSKNALKGAGFFLGGALLHWLGFVPALSGMAAVLAVVLLLMLGLLAPGLGRAGTKKKFRHLLSKSPAINHLSAARFFLFGARDIWFVVALPLFFSDTLGWSHAAIGAWLAAWVIAYGIVQSAVPAFIGRRRPPDGASASRWLLPLLSLPLLMAAALSAGYSPATVVTLGLGLFGVVFAVNSALHSYLVLAWSRHDNVSMDVGFYYMANAGGRLAGTLLSGLIYQQCGMIGCLLATAGFLFASALFARRLPR